MSTCGIPQCREPSADDYPICAEHLANGYLDDYRNYQDLLDEGLRRIDAAVRCGLLDPPED